MRQVECHRYWVTLPGRRLAFLTDFVMDAETAKRDYPGATPEASSRVVCEEPETEEERIEWLLRHQSARGKAHFVTTATHPVPSSPGTYRFLDDIGGPSQLVDVIHVDGELIARFQATDEDESADLPVEELAGQFLPLE